MDELAGERHSATEIYPVNGSGTTTEGNFGVTQGVRRCLPCYAPTNIPRVRIGPVENLNLVDFAGGKTVRKKCSSKAPHCLQCTRPGPSRHQVLETDNSKTPS